MGYYVFLYTGFIKGVPISLEEAAKIDGCNRYQTFLHIVFPLLKPITMTVIVLSFLASWNDFIISMIICQKLEKRTLPLMQFYFFGEYSANVSVAFAASLIAMLPAVIIYFCAQKYIVAGMTAGAVKSYMEYSVGMIKFTSAGLMSVRRLPQTRSMSERRRNGVTDEKKMDRRRDMGLV